MPFKACPKCKSVAVNYIEQNSSSITFDVDENGYASEIGYLADGADPYAVFGLCKNGHEWKLRGVRQITELQNSKEEKY
jgi:hypothetical protein